MQAYLKLESEIKQGTIKPVYLFFGEDLYLANKLLKELENACFDQGDPIDFNYDLLDGETVSLVSILEAALTLPVFAGKRLIMVKNAHWFKPKTGKSNDEDENEADNAEEIEEVESETEIPLLNYLAEPSPTTVLVFFTKGKADKRRKLYKEITKKGAAWEGRYLKGQDLRNFINHWLKARGKKVDRITLETIADYQQGDLEYLEKELEKLVSYVGERKEVKLSDAEGILSIADQSNIFDLTDAVGTKDTGKALWLLRKMFSEGETHQYILSMLTYQLRLIIQTKALAAKNLNQQQIIEGIKGHPYPITKALRQSRNFDIGDLIFALEKLLEADVAIKLGNAEARTILEQTIFELCS